MCNDAFPSALELTAHQTVKHGKLITEADEQYEQRKQAKETRDKKREQRHRREAAAKTQSTFSCDQCKNHFSSQKDLDDHTCQVHTFVCQLCNHITKTMAELDFHIDTKHDLTPRRLPARSPEDGQMVRDWRYRTMLEDQQK